MAGSLLEVVAMGHPVLQEVSRPIDNPLSPDIKALIENMETTVNQMNCSGLAAPQVCAPVRLVIFRVPKTTTNPAYKLTPEYDPEGVPWTVMINPQIVPVSDEVTIGWEPCLSLPGLMGKVPRYHSIRYTYLNRQGQEESRTAYGFHARVVQHECDHLDGILFPQRMTDMRTLGFKEEILKRMGTS